MGDQLRRIADHVGVRPVCDVIGCRDCGLIQRAPRPAGPGTVRCLRCDRVLERNAGRSLDGALACALTTLILLFPANLLPLLRTDILQASNRSFLLSGFAGFWGQHWQLVAVIAAAEVVFLPFVRFGLLSAVLIAVKAGSQGRWLGPAFRWSELLDQWAMLDIFLIAGGIGYCRVAPYLPVYIEAGGWCLIAASLMTLVTRATLERRELWRRIGPVVEDAQPATIVCTGCDLPLAAQRVGRRCPRCAAKVWVRRPHALMRMAALAAAALVFYPAAYLYPMEYSQQLNRLDGYTIMTGVNELIQAHLWAFAALIFMFSIVTPLLKLFALAWCGLSIHRRSSRRLRLKTKLYRLVDAIGRWSHVDVFTVSVFLPLMSLPHFLGVVVGWALPAFLAVVVLTMLASSEFDPRALWSPAAAAS